VRHISIRRVMVSAVIFSVLALSPDWILAQGLFGSITGVVTDPTGALVPNATVKVTT
jgi:hypothetical protein